MSTSIAVLGSINMDLVAQVREFPQPGETIHGFDFNQLPGGKGANQSVAVAKLGGDVGLYGLLGDDLFAETLEDRLMESGVGMSAVERKNTSSGLALIMVDREGENEIVVVGGANRKLNEDYIDKYINQMERADVLLLQLEIPISTVRYLLNKLSSSRPAVILDPAPAREISELNFPLDKVDFWTPNETELDILVSKKTASTEDEKIDHLLGKGVNKVIVTRSAEGVRYADGKRRLTVSGFGVDSIDTTAAGDAFNGALGVALAKDYDCGRALQFASAAGALATTEKGAQPSMPTGSEVTTFLEENSGGSLKK